MATVCRTIGNISDRNIILIPSGGPLTKSMYAPLVYQGR